MKSHASQMAAQARLDHIARSDLTDAGRCARQNDITPLQGEKAAQVAYDLRAVGHHVSGVALLSDLAVDPQLQVDIVRIGDQPLRDELTQRT